MPDFPGTEIVNQVRVKPADELEEEALARYERQGISPERVRELWGRKAETEFSAEDFKWHWMGDKVGWAWVREPPRPGQTVASIKERGGIFERGTQVPSGLVWGGAPDRPDYIETVRRLSREAQNLRAESARKAEEDFASAMSALGPRPVDSPAELAEWENQVRLLQEQYQAARSDYQRYLQGLKKRETDLAAELGKAIEQFNLSQGREVKVNVPPVQFPGYAYGNVDEVRRDLEDQGYFLIRQPESIGESSDRWLVAAPDPQTGAWGNFTSVRLEHAVDGSVAAWSLGSATLPPKNRPQAGRGDNFETLAAQAEAAAMTPLRWGSLSGREKNQFMSGLAAWGIDTNEWLNRMNERMRQEAEQTALPYVPDNRNFPILRWGLRR